jgi:phosphoribosyl-dephospho-CoA transferase
MHSRHDLLWLSARGWHAALATADAAHVPTIKRWRDAGWPVIVTRRHPGAAPDTLCLGIAAPSRQRIALTSIKAHVTRHQWPPLLAQVIDHAPGDWRAGLAELEESSYDMQLRVYGSLALQALTGQQYLRATSDIDLLFQPRSRAHLNDGVARLSQGAGPAPLDGEIVFPGGAAVAWKEWHSGAARVLVKHGSGVNLMPPAALLEALAP